MRVNIRQKEILKVGKQIVESCFPRNDLVPMLDMNLHVGVKIPQLLEKGGTSLRVSVFDRELRLETKAFAIDITGDAVVNATIAESTERDRVSRIREELCLYNESIDVTRFISNDIAKASNRKTKNYTEKTLSMEHDGRITLEASVSPDLPPVIADQDVTEDIMRDMIQRGKDPATLFGNFPVPSPDVVVRAPWGSTKNESSNEMQRSFYRIVGRPGIYKKGTYRTEFFPVRFTVSMPYAKISQTPQLFFHIEAIDAAGIAVDYIIARTDTSLIIDDADRFLLSSGMTTTILSDVTYTREVQPPRTSWLNYFVANSDLLVQSSGQRVGNPLLIRRVTTGRGSISSRFSGSVYLRKPTYAPGTKTGSNEIPFFVTREGDTVTIRLVKVPRGVISVGVQRKDAGRNEVYADITAQELCSQGSGLAFSDSDLRDGAFYEYRLRFVDKHSNNRFTTNTYAYHFKSAALLSPSILTIADVKKLPASTPSGNVPLVNITVNVSTTSGGIIETLNAITGEGASTSNLVISQTADPINFSPVPAFYVKRMNMRTGLVESLGLYRDKLIVDDSALPGGRNKGIQPLSFFEEYRYIVSLCMISPSSLSTTQVSTAIDPTSGRSYQFNAYKFKSRMVFTDLPSASEMSNIASRSITQRNSDGIDVGVESSVVVNFNDMLPRVTDLQIRSSYIRSNLLTWRLTGDPKLVDHFQIYAESDGVMSLLGCAHSFTGNGIYRFDDRQLYDRVGRVNYYVKPVTLDFTRIEGDAYVSIVVSNTLKDHIMM